MVKKSDVGGIIKTGVILFLITGIAAFILAGVNMLTEPVIAKNEEEKRQAAMEKVVPGTESFEVSNIKCADDGLVKEIYTAIAGGKTVGYAVITEPKGYGGAISMVVGIDTENKVIGIDITRQSETAGLGSKCTDDEFKNQFTGKTGEICVVKNNAKDNQIDAITSATITSKAVTEGVNAALSAVSGDKGVEK